MEYLGFVTEVTYGEEPDSIQPLKVTRILDDEQVTESQTIVNARFDCPCCGKGISIRLELNGGHDEK